MADTAVRRTARSDGGPDLLPENFGIVRERPTGFEWVNIEAIDLENFCNKPEGLGLVSLDIPVAYDAKRRSGPGLLSDTPTSRR
jgi:hypothetical protein